MVRALDRTTVRRRLRVPGRHGAGDADDGVTAVEYAIVLGFLCLVVLAGIVFLGAATCDVHRANAESVTRATGATSDGDGC